MIHTTDGYPVAGPDYLRATEFFDYDTPIVRDFADRALDGATADPTDKAVRLYYAVRDEIRYDPYRIRMDRALYTASNVLEEGAAFCLPKASLLVALARYAGIPTAIGLADVTNHLCTERLRRLMGGKELFIDHGYALMLLDGNWVKAAPAFNIELCDRFDVKPTEFDGKGPALYQEFDKLGRRHMEYVADHGAFSDFPIDRVIADFTGYYPPTFIEDAAREAALNEMKAADAKNFEDEIPLT